MAVPRSATKGVERLALHLASLASSDLEKARVIYRWLTANIQYDSVAYFSGQFPPMDPASVLSRRSAVCAGYANLFAALARAMGLQVEVVAGFAKGYRYAVGEPLGNEPNHDWNAVRIDGHWYLVDATWGSGHLDDLGRSVSRFSEFYFLVPPEQLIYSHLPVDAAWQLLDPPLERSEFARLPHVRPAFFELGLGLRSHHEAMIEADQSLTIEIDAPARTSVIATINGDKRDAAVTPVARGFRIDCRFPAAGAYAIDVFGRKRGDDGLYTGAIEYLAVVGSERAAKTGVTAPRALAAGHQVNVLLPRGQSLYQGRRPFALVAPQAVELSVIQGDRRTRLTGRGDYFSGEVPLRRGRCRLVARFRDSVADELIADYRVLRSGFATTLRALVWATLVLTPATLYGVEGGYSPPMCSLWTREVAAIHAAADCAATPLADAAAVVETNSPLARGLVRLEAYCGMSRRLLESLHGCAHPTPRFMLIKGGST
ncbi:transglutaminase domain-containing protein [Accumulibacter sp.]|uniref:transglutaminase domain-containing protein n=1 Tax=Accumulibacter sp. TaxID=2053492 RepID=UPI0025E6356E|nr:transglutaminase domain-containing protein [Accumulibacter sp.]MCM8595563.1 hypothetical protein [Accumulibacter sp.]MCM8625066.1 hypothetical protein [Accumulibacter sp.]MDS4049711.1 transglutaminase domain-containing protein [Accumulibacter sp.]